MSLPVQLFDIIINASEARVAGPSETTSIHTLKPVHLVTFSLLHYIHCPEYLQWMPHPSEWPGVEEQPEGSRVSARWQATAGV